MKKHQNLRSMILPAGEILNQKEKYRRMVMPGKVEICGVNTARLKILSQKEMDMLLRKSKEGDKDAREKLIEGNTHRGEPPQSICG